MDTHTPFNYSADQERITYLEKRIRTKDEVLAEMMAEHVAINKCLGRFPENSQCELIYLKRVVNECEKPLWLNSEACASGAPAERQSVFAELQTALKYAMSRQTKAP